MNRVLIVLGNYSPSPSSVANCMKPLINKLLDIYTVDVVTDRKKVDISEYEKKKNINIYRVDDYRIMNTTYSNELNKIKSSSLIRCMTKLFTRILKISYYLRYVLFAKEQGTGGWEEKRVLEKIIELDKKHHYDIIISVSLPFQSHYVAEKLKNIRGDNLKWIVFEFDPFTLNSTIKVNKRRRKKMGIDEKRILKKCDAICLTPELYDYYNKVNFIQLTSKVNILPFANLKQIEFDFIKVNNNFMIENKINCLFTGQIYADIRNPKRLLEAFSKQDAEIHLSLMTNFSINDMIEYSPKDYLPSVIPFQNRDTALYNLMCANILINIGNTVEHQVPAKIFEYMSTGKPIIHFSKIRNDPALKYLKRYPNTLIINEWEFDEVNYIELIGKFCKDNQNINLTFDNVNESLGKYSGKTVQDKFINIINTILVDGKQ
ncbi:hypothetical protein MASR2M29_03750 [Spirochaetota bacterium]